MITFSFGSEPDFMKGPAVDEFDARVEEAEKRFIDAMNTIEAALAPWSQDDVLALYARGQKIVGQALAGETGAADVTDVSRMVDLVEARLQWSDAPDLELLGKIHPEVVEERRFLGSPDWATGTAKEVLRLLSGGAAVAMLAQEQRVVQRAIWRVTKEQKGPFLWRGDPDRIESLMVYDTQSFCLSSDPGDVAAELRLALRVVRRHWPAILRASGPIIRSVGAAEEPQQATMVVGPNPLLPG